MKCKKCRTSEAIQNCDMCTECSLFGHYVHKLSLSPHNFPIVNGNLYYVGPAKPSTCQRGHAGRPFTIHFDDGTIVTTTNLWDCGTVPEAFASELPNNAKFVEEKCTQNTN